METCSGSVMPMTIYDEIDQGSDQWKMLRLGLPTASNFSKIMAKGRNDGESKTRKTYMLKLIGERMTGEPAESYTNSHMERGKLMEEEARKAYAFMTDNSPKLIGFIKNGGVGCSPDGLIGTDGLLEIKTKLPDIQLEVILAKELPPEHKAQVQGQIWVAEREWCDFVSYWPKLPIFIKRIYRDEKYIETLEQSVNVFCEETDKLQQTILEAG